MVRGGEGGGGEGRIERKGVERGQGGGERENGREKGRG